MKRPVAIALASMIVIGIVLAACAPAAAPAPVKAVETKSVKVATEVPTKVVVTKDAAIDAAPTGVPALPGKSQGNQTSPAAAGEAVFPFVPSPVVTQMISEVDQREVYSLTGYLSGEIPLFINGQTYSLQNRNAYYSQDILTATQYVRDFLQARGIAAGYRDWSGEDEDGDPVSGRSVVGVITGTVHPTDIVLVMAHLDNILDDGPEDGRALGADDNASGSVGAMQAAARLAGHKFDRTVRFLFTADEEYEGLSASTYVDASKAARENIVAVYNMDMIGWDHNNDGMLALETRYMTSTGYTRDLAIANVFTQVVSTYGLSTELHPSVDACNDNLVDSDIFWDNGFSGITAIEDFGGKEQNQNMHTVNDNLASLNLPFFTSFVKASVGTIAHLAIPIE
jgi:hypothetical protein